MGFAAGCEDVEESDPISDDSLLPYTIALLQVSNAEKLAIWRAECNATFSGTVAAAPQALSFVTTSSSDFAPQMAYFTVTVTAGQSVQFQSTTTDISISFLFRSGFSGSDCSVLATSGESVFTASDSITTNSYTSTFVASGTYLIQVRIRNGSAPNDITARII